MSVDSAGNPPKPAGALVDLREAFAEDWAARRLTLEYQPQINLISKQIVRFEALLRWRHQSLGPISASDFIPMAEEMGIIGDVGQWVLERACADAMAWPANVGVAVNVSATRLHDPLLPSIVENALRQSGLWASRLELEITETADIVIDTDSFRILTALKALGLRITIDDLDVGHSSFRYLLEFPFDKIKVDASYTALLGQSGRQSETSLAIMRSISGLCHRLNISCLAEGVETVEQLTIVMGANYTEVQGYLFSRPVTPDKIPATLAEIGGIWEKFALPLQRSVAANLSFFQVADAATDVIIVTTSELDAPGPSIVYVNPAFTRLTGFSAEEAIGQSPRMLQGEGTSRAALDAIRLALSEGRAAHEKVLNFAKCGAPYWLDMRIEPLRDASGTITHFVAIERDVTLDKRRADELEFVADRDVLTGIPNRRSFLRGLEADIAAARRTVNAIGERAPSCFAYIEVDRFKEVTGNFGANAGDVVLFESAGRLVENMRRVDTVGRFEGERFAICLPATALKDAHDLVDRLRRSISAMPVQTVAGPITITFSIGVAELAAGEGLASLMARADAAMLEARQAGGNRVFSN